MKKNFFTGFLLLVITLILFMTIFLAMAIYMDLIPNDVKDFVNKIIPNVFQNNEESKLNFAQNSLLAENELKTGVLGNKADSNYYYKQLTDNQKVFYNALLNNKDNFISGEYVIYFGDYFKDILEKENGIKNLQFDYQTAIEAFLHDNVDLFYIDITKIYLNIETITKLWSTTYNVFIGPKTGENYYISIFHNEDEVIETYKQIEEIKDQILGDLDSNVYNTIKKIHDYMINNLEYDTDYDSTSAYTIYGALIKNRCVCDGYARAFKYLANSAGIDCELIQGIATNSSGKVESHAWNAVKVNDKWYYIDVTWDDPIVVGKRTIAKSKYYTYFLKGASTFKISHNESGKFSENGKTFSYPEISLKDYNDIID